ncbi:hypothetical protein C8F04DRAFT_1095375 [Mycena alexandri]|uniref:DUF6533 domain-containing protein n=1 Tax=Mycena alexandri TaxID=1745969 RepID=A0AAD6T1Y1_9AGAR|nr:hypothetical protein C8F04DRAFT_1095375 [Mycena alexandri]
MSETATEAQIQEAIYISRILILVPLTVLVYEYLLTLEYEASTFWGTRLTWGSFFFYLNRYTSLFGTLPILIQYYSTTTEPRKQPVCQALRLYHQYFALLSQVLVSVMLIMRTFALYQRNKTVLAFMLVVTIGAFVFAVVILLSGNDVDTLAPNIAAFGCPEGTSHAKSLRLAGAWSGMLVFDIMIFSLTLVKAFKMNARRGDLLTLLVRDGSIYFGIMVISNACNIGTYTMSGPFLRGGATTVTNVVSSVMISRLMLNLRDPMIRRPQSNNPTRLSSSEDPVISTVSPYTTEYTTTNTQWTSVLDDQ